MDTVMRRFRRSGLGAGQSDASRLWCGVILIGRPRLLAVYLSPRPPLARPPADQLTFERRQAAYRLLFDDLAQLLRHLCESKPTMTRPFPRGQQG